MVIVPLDGSASAERALPMARQLAHSLLLPLILLHVVDSSAPVPGHSLTEVAAQDYLSKLTASFDSGIDVQPRLFFGDPATEILRLAHSDPQNSIVLAASRSSFLKSAHVGRIAGQILEHRSVSTVLVPGSGEVPADRLRHLLLPLDGSKENEQLLPLATMLARRNGATLGLIKIVDSEGVYVQSNPEVRSNTNISAHRNANNHYLRLQQEAQYYLSQVAQQVRARGVRAVWEVRVGHPTDEIVRTAETTATDLILMLNKRDVEARDYEGLRALDDQVMLRSFVPTLRVPLGSVSTQQ